MAYIGKTPTIGNFQVCDAISVVNNQAAYTMQVGSVNVSPESANHMIVSLNGVIQKPTDAFTVSGSTITFASNLVTGDVINFIQILGNVLDLGVPSDATVSTAKLASTSVTAAKLNNDIITGQTAETSIADGDTILIHDASASALRKMTKANFVSGIGGTNTPAFSVKISSGNQSISGNSNTLVNFDSEVYDIGGGYNTSSKRFTVPSGEAGKYHFTAKIGIQSNSQYDAASKQYTIEMYHYNSSNSIQNNYRGRTTFSQVVNPTLAVAADVNMAVGDYVYVDILITDATTLLADGAYSTFSGFKLIE